MRQLEGNRTENKLSAERRKARLRLCEPHSKAIGRFATTLLAWTARIRSSLLLKTASFCTAGASAAANPSIEYSGEHAR